MPFQYFIQLIKKKTENLILGSKPLVAKLKGPKPLATAWMNFVVHQGHWPKYEKSLPLSPVSLWRTPIIY